MGKKRIYTKEIFFILFILIFCILFSVIFSIFNIGNSNILNGIFINGIDVSGLSKEDAKSLITSFINTKMNNQIIVTLEDGTSSNYSFEDFDISYNISECVNNAFNIGRTGNIFENNFTIFNLLINKKNLALSININEEKLNNAITDMALNLKNPMVENSYYIEDNYLVIDKGTAGTSIDKETFKNSFYNNLKNLSNENTTILAKTITLSPDELDINKIYDEIHTEAKNAFYTKEPLNIYPETVGLSFDKNSALQLLQTEQEEYMIPLDLTYPDITVNDLDIDIFPNLISSFKTEYNVSNIDRVNNLNLAASKIDGTILAPNEEFSYNKIVGARTISAGYKEAKIYSNGSVIDGLGGGICQISSTLYNSAIYANLNITERHPHQFLTSYVPFGRDATVSYGSKDLKFVNNRSYPIRINVSVQNGTVMCSIYGIKEASEYNVDIDVEIVSVKPAPIKYEEDSSINYGNEFIKQSGANGANVNVYKVLKLDGNIISRTLLSQDKYHPLDKIIIRNSQSTK